MYSLIISFIVYGFNCHGIYCKQVFLGGVLMTGKTTLVTIFFCGIENKITAKTFFRISPFVFYRRKCTGIWNDG